MQRNDMVWKSAKVSKEFLDGMRGAIPLATEQIDVMLRMLKTTCPTLENFLDLGCGDGILGRAILTQFPDAQGVLLDFSEPMIDEAQRKVGNEGKNLTFVVQDYGVPEWVEAINSHAPFDGIVSGFSIHHQPDRRKREIYQEIYHLLKPGGIFLNLEHVAPVSDWVEQVFDDMFIDAVIAYNERKGTNQPREDVARDYHERPHKEANILAPLEKQCQWLREIGFAHVDCYLKIFELALFGGVRPNV